MTFVDQKVAAVYSSGVPFLIELIFIQAKEPILSWIQEVAQVPKIANYTHPKVVVTYSEDQQAVDWGVPEPAPVVASGEAEGQKKKSKKKKRSNKAASSSVGTSVGTSVVTSDESNNTGSVEDKSDVTEVISKKGEPAAEPVHSPAKATSSVDEASAQSAAAPEAKAVVINTLPAASRAASTQASDDGHKETENQQKAKAAVTDASGAASNQACDDGRKEAENQQKAKAAVTDASAPASEYWQHFEGYDQSDDGGGFTTVTRARSGKATTVSSSGRTTRRNSSASCNRDHVGQATAKPTSSTHYRAAKPEKKTSVPKPSSQAAQAAKPAGAGKPAEVKKPASSSAPAEKRHGAEKRPMGSSDGEASAGSASKRLKESVHKTSSIQGTAKTKATPAAAPAKAPAVSLSVTAPAAEASVKAPTVEASVKVAPKQAADKISKEDKGKQPATDMASGSDKTFYKDTPKQNTSHDLKDAVKAKDETKVNTTANPNSKGKPNLNFFCEESDSDPAQPLQKVSVAARVTAPAAAAPTAAAPTAAAPIAAESVAATVAAALPTRLKGSTDIFIPTVSAASSNTSPLEAISALDHSITPAQVTTNSRPGSPELPQYLYGADPSSGPPSVFHAESDSGISDAADSAVSAPPLLPAQAQDEPDDDGEGSDVEGSIDSAELDALYDVVDEAIERFNRAGSAMDPREAEMIEAAIEDRKDGIVEQEDGTYNLA